MTDGGDSCRCILPDGRNVELLTREGSDAFLRAHAAGPGGFKFFTSSYADCAQLRRRARERRGGRLNPAEKQQLTIVGFMVDSFGRHASDELFDEVVPESEIEYWLSYMMEELSLLAQDPKWQRTGVLEQHDAFTINPCISLFERAMPTQLALEMGFFDVRDDSTLFDACIHCQELLIIC